MPSVYAMKRTHEEHINDQYNAFEQFKNAINCALNKSSSQEDWKKTIKDSISRGININCVIASYGATALMSAVTAGNKELFEFLINNDASVNASDRAGFTPLHKCAQKLVNDNEKFDSIIFEKLLECGANLHAEAFVVKETPLYYISHYGSADLMKLAIKYDADINKKDPTGCSCLAQAILNNRDNLIEVLCDNGALLANIDDYSGGSVFHLAVNSNLPKEEIEKIMICTNSPYHKRFYNKTKDEQLKQLIITTLCLFNCTEIPMFLPQEIQHKILLNVADNYLHDYLSGFNAKLWKRLIKFDYNLILPLVERRIGYIKTVLKDVNNKNQTAIALLQVNNQILQTNNQNEYAKQIEKLLDGSQLTEDLHAFELVFPNKINQLDQNNLALRICRRIEKKIDLKK